MAKSKKIQVGDKTYNITWLVNLIREGKETIEGVRSKSPAEVADAVAKLFGKEQRNDIAAGVTLYGKIIRRSERAILFAPGGGSSSDGLAKFVEAWLPLSQVKVLEGALGHLDSVNMPAWLLEEKNRDVN